MTDFTDTITADLRKRLEEVEEQLGAFDALVQERDRLRAALEALERDDA